jgi:hypothetical protein
MSIKPVKLNEYLFRNYEFRKPITKLDLLPFDLFKCITTTFLSEFDNIPLKQMYMRDITKKELSDAKLYQEEVEYNDGEIDEYYEDCYHEDRDFSVYKPENRWDDYDRGYPDDYDPDK